MTNIVLLTIDSLRADHCNFHRYDRETTPRLRAFAKANIHFENAYSVSSHTRESVPALLTGKHPHTAVDSGYKVVEPTLAALLPSKYQTAAFHSNPFLSRAYGYGRGFDTFDDDLYLDQLKLVALAQRLWDKVNGHNYVRAEEINRRSLGWLDGLSDDEPFFLWNHYMDVHGPYEPPEPYREVFTDTSVSANEVRDLYQRAIDNPEGLSHNEHQLLVNLYDGEVRYIDEQIGAFFDALAKRGLLSETLVIVTSDHGDGLGDNGKYAHPRYLRKELVRVPLVVASPSESDAEVAVPVSGIDITPTVLDTVGVDLKLPGIALQSVWSSPEEHANRHLVLEARGEGEDRIIRRYAVLNRDRWLRHEGPVEADVSSFPEEKLAKVLRNHVERIEAEKEGGDDDTSVPLNRLKALGYRD